MRHNWPRMNVAWVAQGWECSHLHIWLLRGRGCAGRQYKCKRWGGHSIPLCIGSGRTCSGSGSLQDYRFPYGCFPLELCKGYAWLSRMCMGIARGISIRWQPRVLSCNAWHLLRYHYKNSNPSHWRMTSTQHVKKTSISSRPACASASIPRAKAAKQGA